MSRSALRRDVLSGMVARLVADNLIAKGLRRTLRFRCPCCHHLAGYQTAAGTVRCWWPDCQHESDGRDFVEVAP